MLWKLVGNQDNNAFIGIKIRTMPRKLPNQIVKALSIVAPIRLAAYTTLSLKTLYFTFMQYTKMVCLTKTVLSCNC